MRFLLLIVILLLIIKGVNAIMITEEEFNINIPTSNHNFNNESKWNKTIQLINTYNNYFNSMPDIIKNTLSNEVLKLNLIFLDNQTMIIGAKTKDGMINEYQQSPYNDSTIAVYLSEKGLLDIISDKDPLNALKNAWGSEIRYEGLTVFSSVKMFFFDIGFRIYSFFSSLFAFIPVNTGQRSSGLTINLINWWDDVMPESDVVVNMDPLGGGLYLYWLDEEGNICHGIPGISGQPGPIIILGSKLSSIRAKAREHSSISTEEFASLINDSYNLSDYEGMGFHIVHYRNQVWRSRSNGEVFEDYSAVQSAYLINVNLSDYITPIYLLPEAMLRLNGYECSLTDYGLPLPSTRLGSETPQHPTMCQIKSGVTGPMIVEACRDNRLTGSLQEGYLRIV